jgi:hypothetical protein
MMRGQTAAEILVKPDMHLHSLKAGKSSQPHLCLHGVVDGGENRLSRLEASWQFCLIPYPAIPQVWKHRIPQRSNQIFKDSSPGFREETEM